MEREAALQHSGGYQTNGKTETYPRTHNKTRLTNAMTLQCYGYRKLDMKARAQSNPGRQMEYENGAKLDTRGWQFGICDTGNVEDGRNWLGENNPETTTSGGHSKGGKGKPLPDGARAHAVK